MENIKKLLASLGVAVVCIHNLTGQVAPGTYPYVLTVSDSLYAPVKMAIDNADNIYVTDSYRKQIVKYNASGNYIGSVATPWRTISLAINQANQLFIGDAETGKIFRLNPDGSTVLLYAGTVFPCSMTFDSDGYLYVSDSKLKRVIVLDLSGNVIRTIGLGILTCPTGITFDKKNNRILVAEHGGVGTGMSPVTKVWIFGLTGNLITSFGSFGSANGKFYRIQGIAVGRCGEIYVPEPYQGNVSVFSQNTVFACRFASYGDSLGQLRIPLDIAINSQDRIFITADNNGTIEVFNISYTLPTSNINCGNKTICAGSTTDIPIHFTGTAPWTFTYTVNGANPTTISRTYYNPNILSVSIPGNYQVSALSDSSMTGTCFSGSCLVAVNNQVPTSTITTRSVSFCTGQSAVVSIEFTGIPPWSFTYTNNGINPVTISNVTSSPYSLVVNEPGIYAVTALTGNGCPGISFTGTATVTETPLPTAGFTAGVTGICQNDTAYLPVLMTGLAPWSFTYTVSGANPVTVSNMMASPYLLAAMDSGDYTVTHVQDALCENFTASGIHHVTLLPAPSSVISSGNASVCQGDTAWITIDLMGTFPWSLTYTVDGLNPVTIPGILASPYTLPATQAGTYEVSSLTDAVCEGTSLTGSATIQIFPLPVVNLGPPDSLCPGDSIVLDAGVHMFYFWSDSSSGQTLTVYTAGIYSVTVTDSTGCSNSSSVAIFSNPLPTSAITSGNASICSGQTTDITIQLTGTPPWSVTYTVDGMNPATVSGITSSPYLLNVYQPGIYEITETLDAFCKNSESTGSAEVTVHPAPTYNFSSGNVSICTGQTTDILIDLTGTPPWNLVYTLNGTNPVPVNGIPVSPAVLPVSEPGTYGIAFLSDAFCNASNYAGTVTITENSLPQVDLGPDVTIPDGDTLLLDAGPSMATYLWNDGSTGQTLEVSTTGLYSVTVTDYNGCANADSIMINVSIATGIGNIESSGDPLMKIYPNPTTGMVTLEITNPGTPEMKVEITDMSGKTVFSRNFSGPVYREMINLGHLAKGTYAVKLRSGNLVRISKLVLID